MLSKDHDQITVAYKLSGNCLQDRVNELRELYGINFVSLESDTAHSELPLLKLTKSQLQLEYNGQALFFHPSMALLRMINIKRGIGDRFLNALKVEAGDLIIDATMGIASDALISAWAVGVKGKVIAIEYASLIYLLVNEGLKQLKETDAPKVTNIDKEKAWQDLAQAASRIETICADHNSLLTQLPDDSVDIIYFDPMFRDTVVTSSSIKPLKNLSHPEPLQIETIKQACRVARKRIVLKERKNGGEFERLGFRIIEDGKYSSISFGVIELTDQREGDVLCSP